jgi:MoxR-like ATPase
MIYNQPRNEFMVRKGPIFANFILADEINRAPAKVQSALLEAMQERQVTIGEDTFKLDDPFLVLATQNPLEQEGTYPLPEAQVDRFMLKVIVGYPDKKEEQMIIRQQVQDLKSPEVKPVVSVKELTNGRELTRQVYMDEKIEQYIVDLVFATRFPENYGLGKIKSMISYGGSPRASINLALAAKAHAFMEKRGFVIPDDVKAICKDVMRHRIGLTYEAEAENVTSEQIIDNILASVNVP